MPNSRIPCRRLSAGTAALLAVAVMAAPAAAAQEGPGYGGTADGLAVSWSESDSLLAMGSGEGVTLSDSGLALDVFGLGFRGRSEVTVSVGTSGTVTSRVDPTGTLDLSVAVQRLSSGPQPGTSVVVIGRAPAGTSRTLVGAVPPIPSGRGPADVVPVLAGGLLVALGLAKLRRRSRQAARA